MANEVFSSTSYSDAWTTSSDLWILLHPEANQWTEEIDWSLGQLLRRALVREESQASQENQSIDRYRASDVLLLAAPEGLPAARVLALLGRVADGRWSKRDGNWLRELAPILTKMKIKSATVFAPSGWRPPQPKAIAEASEGEWGIRWVETSR